MIDVEKLRVEVMALKEDGYFEPMNKGEILDAVLKIAKYMDSGVDWNAIYNKMQFLYCTHDGNVRRQEVLKLMRNFIKNDDVLGYITNQIIALPYKEAIYTSDRHPFSAGTAIFVSYQQVEKVIMETRKKYPY